MFHLTYCQRSSAVKLALIRLYGCTCGQVLYYLQQYHLSGDYTYVTVMVCTASIKAQVATRSVIHGAITQVILLWSVVTESVRGYCHLLMTVVSGSSTHLRRPWIWQ